MNIASEMVVRAFLEAVSAAGYPAEQVKRAPDEIEDGDDPKSNFLLNVNSFRSGISVLREATEAMTDAAVRLSEEYHGHAHEWAPPRKLWEEMFDELIREVPK